MNVCLPLSDVSTTVELVAGDDDLGPIGENRRSVFISEWDWSVLRICWPQARLTYKDRSSISVKLAVYEWHDPFNCEL